MMKLIAVFVMATCGAQASLVVLPNSNGAVNGNSTTVIPLAEGSADVLFQWDISGTQFGSVPVGSSITALGFRLGGDQTTVPPTPVTLGTFDLQLSTSLNPIGALSVTEANNIGPDAVTVLSGPLTIPAAAFVGGTGPNPFFLIDFTTPYTYRGGDLLFSLHVVNSATAGSIVLDADTVDSIGDTASNLTATRQTEFFNYPVTEIQVGAAAAIPEPSSVLMLGTGLIFLAGFGVRLAKR